jgi:hypothetical protein
MTGTRAPGAGHAAFVALILLGFGGDADRAFDRGIRNHDEAPGLAVGAGGSERGGADGVGDEREGHRLVRKVAHRAARRDSRKEVVRASRHFLGARRSKESGANWGGVVIALL